MEVIGQDLVGVTGGALPRTLGALVGLSLVVAVPTGIGAFLGTRSWLNNHVNQLIRGAYRAGRHDR